MTPAAGDTDLSATPSFDQLVKMSAKATGSPHPGILSLWKDDAGATPGLTHGGENWVLHAKVGDVPIAVIVAGAYQG